MNPSFDLSGKVAMVTGGSKGLGRAMALGFAEAGADIVVASRKLPGCESVAKEVQALGRRALPLACHVSDWAQCEALIEASIAELGRIDVLVNNAGIAPVAPRLLDVTEELFDKTIGVNLKGPLRLAALAAEHMAEGSSIINISSVASLRPIPTTAVYGAAKAGLNTLTQVMAQEFAPKGIRVNAIVCGTFWTDSFRKAVPSEKAAAAAARGSVSRRIAEPEEIVGTALYLATDAASYTTGQLIQVDGGVLP
ncbi:MAG: SDR family oxidoreductase [Deltaproteobacteria bacterium]|nr:SDR family oxidoreductase [Deltaproteobacteria bacterium]MBW2420013.1 SDR family oxidoreductase [Deltaproteobacteria bacterium]